MAEIGEWLRRKLSESLPRADLRPGDVGKDVRSIAEAVAGIEGRGSTAFGLHIAATERAALRSLNSEFRQAVVTWRNFLGEELGDEGREFVDKIALEYGFRVRPPKKLLCDPLGSVKQLNEAQRRAVARLNEALSDTSSLTKCWASEGRLVETGDGVGVDWGDRRREPA